MSERTNLEQKIREAQQAYYDGNEIMSDADFDALWDRLEKIAPDSDVLKKIGADTSVFPKAKHLMPMGSQNKARDEAEFKAWFDKGYDTLYVVEPKLDGASLELQYENGQLKKAITRGNGTQGDLITDNAKRMNGVPATINAKGKVQVRGEVIMTHTVFEAKYTDKANCRNAAAGVMKHKDGSDCEDLTLMVYDANGPEFRNERDKMDWLYENKFNVPGLEVIHDFAQVVEYRTKIDAARKGDLDYDCDGIVIKTYTLHPEDAKENRPTHQIAFKFELDLAIAEVLDVEWRHTGRTFTPVAHLSPVNLCGTTVKQATLCNPNEIARLGVKIGSKVKVAKMGEIIPKVLEVVG